MGERSGMRFASLCGALLVAGSGICRQAQATDQAWEKAAGGQQRFEAASVRENKSGGPSNSNFTLDGNGNAYWVMDGDVRTAPEGDLFRATNQPLLRYIIFAFKLNGTEELALRAAGFGYWSGLGMNVPAWVTGSRYDIEARAPQVSTKDQMRLMMQSLLAERFKLAVHRETRQVPVFAIMVEKPGTLGPALRPHPASDACATTVYPDSAVTRVDPGGATTAVAPTPSINESPTLPIPCGMIARRPASAPGRHRIGGRKVTLAMIAESLPGQTGLATFPRPLIDRAGLGGAFDFTLEWTPPSASDAAPGPNAQGEEAGPPMAEAMKQQLGLKLERTKGPVELLVIDHVERPTAN